MSSFDKLFSLVCSLGHIFFRGGFISLTCGLVLVGLSFGCTDQRPTKILQPKAARAVPKKTAVPIDCASIVRLALPEEKQKENRPPKEKNHDHTAHEPGAHHAHAEHSEHSEHTHARAHAEADQHPDSLSMKGHGPHDSHHHSHGRKSQQSEVPTATAKGHHHHPSTNTEQTISEEQRLAQMKAGAVQLPEDCHTDPSKAAPGSGHDAHHDHDHGPHRYGQGLPFHLRFGRVKSRLVLADPATFWACTQEVAAQKRDELPLIAEMLIEQLSPLWPQQSATWLADSNPSARALAIRGLARVRDGKHMERIIEAIHDPDARVQRAAIDMSRHAGPHLDRAIAALDKVLNGNDDVLKRRALVALTGLEVSASSKLVETFLAKPDAKMRLTALKHIQALQLPAHRASTVRLLQEGTVEEQEVALGIAAQFGYKEAIPLAKAFLPSLSGSQQKKAKEDLRKLREATP